MKYRFLVVLTIFLAAAWALAGEVPLNADPLVAPATGTVTYQPQGSHVRLSIKVADLKPAAQLKPSPRKLYVVWLQEPNRQWRNLGVLQVNGNQALLTATVPAGNMFLLITPENNAHGGAPTGPQIMQATILGQ